MPRVIEFIEHIDEIYYDTHTINLGSHISFFGNENIGDRHLTNLIIANQLNDKAIIFSLGVRLMGLTRDQEDPLLDHLLVSIEAGPRLHGPFPGNLLSTFRYINEEDEKNPVQTPGAFLPGFVLLRPLVVPSRTQFKMIISASEKLPAPVDVRAMAFSIKKRSCL